MNANDLPDPKLTVKYVIEHDNQKLVLPNGKSIEAKDLTSILREYYKLSKEDQQTEKSAWLHIINQILPPNYKGDIITDIRMLPDSKDNHQVVFVYGNPI